MPTAAATERTLTPERQVKGRRMDDESLSRARRRRARAGMGRVACRCSYYSVPATRAKPWHAWPRLPEPHVAWPRDGNGGDIRDIRDIRDGLARRIVVDIAPRRGL